MLLSMCTSSAARLSATAALLFAVLLSPVAALKLRRMNVLGDKPDVAELIVGQIAHGHAHAYATSGGHFSSIEKMRLLCALSGTCQNLRAPAVRELRDLQKREAGKILREFYRALYYRVTELEHGLVNETNTALELPPKEYFTDLRDAMEKVREHLIMGSIKVEHLGDIHRDITMRTMSFLGSRSVSVWVPHVTIPHLRAYFIFMFLSVSPPPLPSPNLLPA